MVDWLAVLGVHSTFEFVAVVDFDDIDVVVAAVVVVVGVAAAVVVVVDIVVVSIEMKDENEMDVMDDDDDDDVNGYVNKEIDPLVILVLHWKRLNRNRDLNSIDYIQMNVLMQIRYQL